MAELDMELVFDAAVARGGLSLSDNVAAAVVAEVGRQLADRIEAEDEPPVLVAATPTEIAKLVRKWTGNDV
jgi:hypothetical protein